MSRENRIERKYPIPVRQAIQEWLLAEGLGPAYNANIIARTWKEVSGMERYTGNVWFKDGTLYVTLTSSVVRSRLSLMGGQLAERINEALFQNEMFIRGKAFTRYVNQIVLK
ncbi:MAG: DUF721 domain-containing protein [Bacteroidales bacterium]|nr:DUF721 domain-containing protein [Bacteroidales bacterium]